MTHPAIDPERWQEVWAADLDVLRSLRENGDRPEILRDVDVSFRGKLPHLKRLSQACGNFGFRVQSFTETGEDGPWLFLTREQATDEEAIRDLTLTYLQIEDAFDVECDGWGCVAQANEEN